MSSTTRRDTEAAALQMFEVDTRDHVMTVLHSDGLYRHIRFTRPGSDIARFHIVTWPGHLSIGGDREGYVFSRVPDMLAWFHEGGRGRGINPGYWAEKLTTGRQGTKTYSEDLVREYITDTVRDLQGQHPGLWRDVKDNVLDDYLDDLLYPDTARRLLRDYSYTYTYRNLDGEKRTTTVAPFENSWEWDLTEFDFSYLWTCWAIRYAATQYYAAHPAPAAHTVTVKVPALQSTANE